MKALIVAIHFPPVIGGSATVMESLCRELGTDAVVLTPSYSYVTGNPLEGWAQLDRTQPFPVERVKLLRPLRKPPPKAPWLGSVWRRIFEDLPLERSVLRQAVQVIERHRPDLVFLNEMYALQWLGSALRRRHSIPVAQFVHGEEITVRELASIRYRRAIRRAIQEYDAFVAVSRFTRGELLRLGASAEKVHLLQNGVDPVRFQPGPKPLNLLERYGVKGRKVLMTIARLEERKGHELVIQAMPQILAEAPDAVYLIVGSGDLEPRLRRLVEELRLSAHVIFAGAVSPEELVDHYRLCDVFVMPNRVLPSGDVEGFGVVFLEAGACGKAVIGGNSGGVPDAVDHEETGLLVSGESVDELARAVLRLLQNPELAARMGAAGRRKAERSSWRQKAVEFRRIAESIIARRRLGDGCESVENQPARKVR